MVESSFLQTRGETMLRRTKNILKSLRNCRSGNAVMIVALGMPALIGGTGYAVDTAQWYLWKREVQFAVDQAAIAGAWAMTDEDTQATYETRAGQEFDANLSVTDDFVSEPDVRLASFAGGTGNSVIVEASASRILPFSGFLTGKAATINVFAQIDVRIAVDGNRFIAGGQRHQSAACRQHRITANGCRAIDGEAVIFVEVAYEYQPLVGDTFTFKRELRAIASFTVRDSRDLTQIYQRDPSDPSTVARCSDYTGVSSDLFS